MPNTKVTRQKWKDHFFYSKKIYIIGTLVAIALASLVFTVTRYIPADEHAVQIQLVDSFVDTSTLEADIQLLMERGVDFDYTLEEITFQSIPYSGEPSDMEAAQVYSVKLMAEESDIFIQNHTLTQNMIANGFCYPLETLEGFEAFNAKYGKYVLWQEEPRPEEEDAGEEDEDEEPVAVPKHAYAIDLSSLKGFITRRAYDINGKYGSVTIRSANAETSFYVLTQMFDIFAYEGEQ